MIDYMDEFVKSTNFNQNKPIREIVYESLRKTIISGVIPVGERIVEKEYASRLNISRTPVREALRMLEMEELIESIPRVGVVVKRISPEDVVEIYKIRQQLEILATTTAMENITKEEINEIKDLLDLTEQKNNDGDVEEVIRLFGEFNKKIYKASGMKRLAGMIGRLNEYIQRFRNISISENERREKALREHREILRLIEEKNKPGLEKIIHDHLQVSIEVVMRDMKNKQNSRR